MPKEKDADIASDSINIFPFFVRLRNWFLVLPTFYQSAERSSITHCVLATLFWLYSCGVHKVIHSLTQAINFVPTLNTLSDLKFKQTNLLDYSLHSLRLNRIRQYPFRVFTIEILIVLGGESRSPECYRVRIDVLSRIHIFISNNLFFFGFFFGNCILICLIRILSRMTLCNIKSHSFQWFRCFLHRVYKLLTIIDIKLHTHSPNSIFLVAVFCQIFLIRSINTILT